VAWSDLQAPSQFADYRSIAHGSRYDSSYRFVLAGIASVDAAVELAGQLSALWTDKKGRI